MWKSQKKNKELSIRKKIITRSVRDIKPTVPSAKEFKMREWFFETFDEQNAYPNQSHLFIH